MDIRHNIAKFVRDLSKFLIKQISRRYLLPEFQALAKQRRRVQSNHPWPKFDHGQERRIQRNIRNSNFELSSFHKFTYERPFINIFDLNKCIRNNLMESSVQTASNQLDLSGAIQQFFDSNDVSIPDEFKQMFINNYQKRNQKFMSDELYQIFKSYGYKSRYRNFCGRFIGILNQVDFKEIPISQILGVSKIGHRPKKYYEVTYKGYQKIMMTIDNQNMSKCNKILEDFFTQYPQFDDRNPNLKQYLDSNIRQLHQVIQDYENIQQKQRDFEETLQKYSHIQSITINNQEIKMYGDIQNPLFDAKQILIDLLGFDKLGSNWFYKNHKKDQRFVKKMGGETTPISKEKMGGNLPPISNEKRYHKNADIIYLTEFGLYECLFTTNKPIAFEFRLQVMQLLKNIRLGNVKLLVQKECEFTNIIQEKNSELMNLITEKSALSKQINDLKDQLDSIEEELQSRKQLLDKCKKTCSLYKQKVRDNDSQIIKEYAGSSINPEKRNKQHRSRSSNPGLREAFQQGYNIEFELIETFEYYTENERKLKERQLILTIPQQQRLNKSLPRI